MLDVIAMSVAITLSPRSAHDAHDAGWRPPAVVATEYQDSGRVDVWRGASDHERSVWLCIRRHESLHAGHWRAANPSSTASGAGQWLDSTWRGVAHWVKFKGDYVARDYSRAMYAPDWVQDLVYRHVYKHGGLSMWHGTWCPGT